jgi:hypothetical protein
MLSPLSIEKQSTNQIFEHRCQIITRKELKSDVESYREKLPEGETLSCILDLDDIKDLIEYYSEPRNLNGANPIDGFRIYFVRGGKYAQPLTKNKRKRQLNIILVPTHKGAKDRHEDLFDDKKDYGQCWILSPGGEGTGLCPNNCGGSI